MEKYELTDKDFELLDRLIKNNTAIESLYTKMYNMEIAGVKKSSDFDKQLELLRLSLEAENRIYEETNLNSQKCLAYIRYIKEVTGDENFPGGIENIVAQNGNYIVFMRIANRLTHKLNSDIQYKRENIHPIVMGILENMGLSDFEKRLKQAIYVSNEIEEAFERDFINAFLSFLKGAIDSEDYSEDCKEGLIVCKYYTSYIYSFVEPNMIACGFEIPEELKMENRMIAELYGMPMIDHEENMSMEGADAAYGQIVRLLGISDSDYDDLSKTLSSIIKQCFIRAAFLFVSEENLEELKAKYHSFLEDKDYIEEHNPKNHRSVDAVERCFSLARSDKEKTITLSMGTKKD